MKPLLVLALLLSASISFAGEKIYMSKAGHQIPPSDDCYQMEPIRTAKVTANITRFVVTQNENDNSVYFDSKPVCQIENQSPVFGPLPEGYSCYSFEAHQSEMVCDYSNANSSGQVKLWTVVEVSDQSKRFSTMLNRFQANEFDFKFNNVTAFDPNLKKIGYTLSADSIAVGLNTTEQISAIVTVEDNL